LCIIDGDQLRSFGASAPDDDVVSSRSESPGQTTTLWTGPAQNSYLHADGRGSLPRADRVASCLAACMVTRSIVLAGPNKELSVVMARMSFMTSTSDPTTEARSATSDPSRPTISLGDVVLDTDDPPRLAEFYTTLLGWHVVETEDDWITIADGSGARIAFQLALNHKPPTWPDNAVPQQFHLDLDVDDLDKAAAYAESIGARRAESGDHSPNFIVFLDPSGHPFCLCS
jgi:catechol 2,3-dioxygenase-like lactoylglutathione lyase family enzyme